MVAMKSMYVCMYVCMYVNWILIVRMYVCMYQFALKKNIYKLL